MSHKREIQIPKAPDSDCSLAWSLDFTGMKNPDSIRESYRPSDRSILGELSEWLKEPACNSGGFSRVGSNPTLSTT